MADMHCAPLACFLGFGMLQANAALSPIHGGLIVTLQRSRSSAGAALPLSVAVITLLQASISLQHVTPYCEHLCDMAGADADAEKARDSRNIRRGKGKMRNRRYTTRKGPLVVYSEDSGIVRAFRNIPGVDVARVDRLNLLQVTVGLSASLLL